MFTERKWGRGHMCGSTLTVLYGTSTSTSCTYTCVYALLTEHILVVHPALGVHRAVAGVHSASRASSQMPTAVVVALRSVTHLHTCSYDQIRVIYYLDLTFVWQPLFKIWCAHISFHFSLSDRLPSVLTALLSSHLVLKWLTTSYMSITATVHLHWWSVESISTSSAHHFKWVISPA